MELTIKQPNVDKKSTPKTVQFLNSNGEKKVFDIHHYDDSGILFYKRKSQLAI